jgi:dethiobiotin synthetase
VVSRNYLGSINHTLLTISELMTRNIPIIGIVFNGVRNDATEGVILNQTKIPLLFRINEEKEITSSIIEIYSDSIKRKLNNFFDK